MTSDRTRPTSRDVARAAGVSQAAVSLVLGGKWRGRVSPGKAEAVREAARELGYRPNLAARSLRLGRTRTALLVVPALTNEFFARLHAGAARVAAEHGFGVVLYPSPEGVGPARDPFDSAGTALDGVIASSMASEALAALRSGGELPLVMLDSEPENTQAAATVNLDIADGMRQVAAHLLGLGHRRLAHIAAAVDSWTFEVRARALAEALRAAGCPPPPTSPSALGVADGMRAAERALATSPRPTALVCDDDVLAAGACKAVRRLGLRVPEDVSVTGFDDLALARAVEPELTTVRLPAEEAGAAGMRALLAVLDGRKEGAVLDGREEGAVLDGREEGAAPDGRKEGAAPDGRTGTGDAGASGPGSPTGVTTLPVELVVRGSTAPPPDAHARPGGC
ncbi:LacI family DNA-binding transcriptional regulator [Streptomyces sp. DH37]|uniref:LacI family DNA-binding transcriptional regulator n=1 Tax=Streptomyces sp. DH37 TaxID=3040122 RepID=UPI002441220E|nr:LacI family DNA-binding transcriptional regulator [Streptomyces sp. DH37]MDG9705656.1 LacI family DNA-binding transcriptional regulator [Streptomyces sp. DH37]